jgi:hypothetical protein
MLQLRCCCGFRPLGALTRLSWGAYVCLQAALATYVHVSWLGCVLQGRYWLLFSAHTTSCWWLGKQL